MRGAIHFTKFLLSGMLACLLAGTAAAQMPHTAAKDDGGRSASLKPGDATSPANRFGAGAHSPTEELFYVLACMASLGGGNLADAQKQCTQAIKLDSRDPAPYKLRGASYLFQSRFEQARVDFERAVRLDPADAENYAGYGEALRGQGKYAEAISQFDAAIRVAPSDPRMWNARCWTRGAFGRELGKGLSDCNVALRFAPDQASILDSRGLIYLRMGKLSLAERDFSASIRRSPGLATALYGRGIARLRHGDTKGAQQDILQARQIDQKIDDIFFWKPLISQQCLTGIVRDHGWRCRPSKRRSPNQASPLSKTAMTMVRSLLHSLPAAPTP